MYVSLRALVVSALYSLPVLAVHLGHLSLDVLCFGRCSLDRCRSVSLLYPSFNVSVHLGEAARLLVDVITQSALVCLVVDLVDELQAARLASSVLLGALLPKVTPPPIPTRPSCLVEVAHSF